jgi:hypothetical protein
MNSGEFWLASAADRDDEASHFEYENRIVPSALNKKQIESSGLRKTLEAPRNREILLRINRTFCLTATAMVRHSARQKQRSDGELRARKPVLERPSPAYQQKSGPNSVSVTVRAAPGGSHSGAAECPRRRGCYDPARVVGNRETAGSLP